MTLQQLESFYHLLKPAQESSDEAFVWFSGLKHPLFNAVMHLKEDLLDSLIKRAPVGIPVSFWADSKDTPLKLALKNRGFSPLMTCPLMTWDVTKVASSPYEIKKAHLETFNTILGTLFHFSDSLREEYGKLIDQPACENYLVYREGKPVGTGTLAHHNGTGGIFNISVLEEHQRQGCAKAMMLHLMNRAYQLNLSKVVLLSSKGAEKIYSDLNFKSIQELEIFI